MNGWMDGWMDGYGEGVKFTSFGERTFERRSLSMFAV